MAISRHDPEWQRVIATAALAGVVFQQIAAPYGRGNGETFVWEATLPTGRVLHGSSKIATARRALLALEVAHDGT